MKKMMILLALMSVQAWSQTVDSTMINKSEPAIKEVATDTTKVVVKEKKELMNEVKQDKINAPEPKLEELKKDTVKVAAPIVEEVKDDSVKAIATKKDEPEVKEVTKDTTKVVKKEAPVVQKGLAKVSVKDTNTVMSTNDSVIVAPKPEPKKIVVTEISTEEKQKLIEKNIKDKEIKTQILNRKIEAITKAFKTDSKSEMKELKKVIRQETQYLTDIEKIKKSTFLTQRIKDKKTAFTNNKLRKVIVQKDDLIDDIEKIAYVHFTNIAVKRTSLVNSLQGTEKIIEKMNVRLELMRIGRSILAITKTELTESYNIKVVDTVIDGMERNFIKKYEELVSAYK